MTTIRHVAFVACTAISLAALATSGQAQPGPRMMDPDMMMGPNMMMGPGMMGRHAMGRMCSPAAVGFVGWRIERIERLIKPTGEQRTKLDELKAASKTASEAMRAACPTDIPATVTGRMEAMEKRMEAMLAASKTMRPAWEAFYATLSDEQKARLNSDGRGRFWHWRGHW